MQTQTGSKKTTRKPYNKAAFAADLKKLDACEDGLNRFVDQPGRLAKVLAVYASARAACDSSTGTGRITTGLNYSLYCDISWLLDECYYGTSPAANRLARALKAAGFDVPRRDL